METLKFDGEKPSDEAVNDTVEVTSDVAEKKVTTEEEVTESAE